MNRLQKTVQHIKQIPSTIRQEGGIIQYVIIRIKRLLRFISRIFIPLMLVLLMLLPILLSVFGSGAVTTQIDEPIAIQRGLLKKTIRTSAAIEFDYISTVRVYQNAVIERLDAKEGSPVINGTVIGKIKPITSPNIRTTEIDNQIAQISNQIASLEASKAEAEALNGSVSEQERIQIASLDEQIAQASIDINEILAGLNGATIEIKIDVLEEQYDDLELAINITNSLKQYEDELKIKENSLESVQDSIDSIRSQIDMQEGIVATLQATCTDPADPCWIQLSSANQTLDNLNDSLNKSEDTKDELEDDIEELEDNIEELKKFKDLYEYTPNGYPITDAIQNGQAQRELAKLQADITKANTLNTQIEQLQRSKRDIIAQLETQNINRDQSINSLSRSIDATNLQLQSLYNSRNDLLNDIAEQASDNTLVARKDGIISKIYADQGDEVQLGSTIVDIISQKKVMRFTLNAEDRAAVQPGMEVTIVAPDSDLERTAKLKLDRIGLAPKQQSGALGAAAAFEYEIEIDLPTAEWVVGKDVDIEILLEKRDEAMYIPSTAIFENKVFIARDRVEVGGMVKFREIEAVTIQTGLETGQFTQVTWGLDESNYVFAIHPRTEEQQESIYAKYLLR